MNTMPLLHPVIVQKKVEPFDDPEWLFELKYDGFRGILHHDEAHCFFVSKQKKRLAFKNLEKQLKAVLKREKVILDGEVVCLDEMGVPIFFDLIRRKSSLAYVVFDILWLNGTDLRPLPLIERKKILEAFVKKIRSPLIQCASYIPLHGISLFKLTLKRDLEGVVAKHMRGNYSKRTRWYKIKNREYSQEKGKTLLFKTKRKNENKKQRTS